MKYSKILLLILCTVFTTSFHSVGLSQQSTTNGGESLGISSDNQLLISQNERLKSEKTQISKEKESLNEDNQLLVKENNRLRSENANITNEIKLIKTSIQNLSKGNENLTKEKSKLSNQNESLKKSRDELLENINDINTKRQELQKEYEQLKIENQELNTGIAQNTSDTISKVNSQTADIELNYTENANLYKTIIDLNAKIDEYKIKIADLQKINEQFNKENTDIKTQISDFNRNNEVFKREINGYKTQINDLANNNEGFKKEIDTYKTQIANLTKNNDVLVKENTTYKNQINLLNINNERSNKEITDLKQKTIKIEEVVDYYKSFENKSFDDLIRESSKSLVERDIVLLSDKSEIAQILIDLLNYFLAEETILNQFNPAQITNTLKNLDQITMISKLRDALKTDLERYEIYHNELKETITKIVEMDESVTAQNIPEAREMKFTNFASNLDKYTFNRPNFKKYPYLSNIIIEIIERKLHNVDASIKDLLNKL